MKPDYVVAYKTSGMFLAESIVALLKSFEIDSFADQESAGITYGLTVGPLGEARIYVPQSQLSDAQKILAQMERGELQVPTSNDSVEGTPTDDDTNSGDQ